MMTSGPASRFSDGKTPSAAVPASFRHAILVDPTGELDGQTDGLLLERLAQRSVAHDHQPRRIAHAGPRLDQRPTPLLLHQPSDEDDVSATTVTRRRRAVDEVGFHHDPVPRKSARHELIAAELAQRDVPVDTVGERSDQVVHGQRAGHDPLPTRLSW